MYNNKHERDITTFGRVLVVLFIIALFIIVIFAMNAQEIKRLEWADNYEKCVQKEYNMTPSNYYQSQGHYPDCTVINE